MQAIILAGGKGTRLMPLTADRPKPLVEVNGKAFIDYQLELLKANGIERVLILVGHLGQMIVDHVGDGSRFGLTVAFDDAGVDAGTGARLRHAHEYIEEEFLLLYCDNYWPLKIDRLLAFHRAHGVAGTATVYKNADGYSKNNTRVGGNGFVEIYDKERAAEGLNGVEAGFFILKKSALAALPDGDSSFERTVLPDLIARKQLAGFLTDHRYYTIGSIERFEQAVEFLRPRKVVLLDRDGVINRGAPKAEYITTWKDFHFLPDAVEGLVELSRKGYELYVVTNQAGIARGMLSEGGLSDIHARMSTALQEHGITIIDIYHCPHGWDSTCECRKPQPGMLYQAAREHHFDLTKALFIGDNDTDAQAAAAADCRFELASETRTLLDIARKLP